MRARVSLFITCAVCALVFTATARAEMPEIKITNAQMVQMPHFRFILPNSAIEFSVHQRISGATFNVDSKYDNLS